MGFIPCPNVVEAALLYSQNETPVENVYHFHGAAAWTNSDLDALATTLQAWESGHAAANRSNHTALTAMYLRDLTTANSLSAEYIVVPNIVGSQAGALLPNNVTISIAHRTGLAGRSFRGRSYWVGLTANQIVENSITTGAQAALLAAMNFMLPFSSPPNSAQLVVLSRRHNNADRAAGVATPVTNFTIEGTLDSQRRRLPGHNRHR